MHEVQANFLFFFSAAAAVTRPAACPAGCCCVPAGGWPASDPTGWSVSRNSGWQQWKQWWWAACHPQSSDPASPAANTTTDCPCWSVPSAWPAAAAAATACPPHSSPPDWPATTCPPRSILTAEPGAATTSAPAIDVSALHTAKSSTAAIWQGWTTDGP